jgi:hypothetical protein
MHVQAPTRSETRTWHSKVNLLLYAGPSTILFDGILLILLRIGPLGHLNHPAFECVCTDRTHGSAGRPKQTKLSEGIRAHPFLSQIWARNALARTAQASSRAPLLVRPGPSRQRLQAISPSPVFPCCARSSSFPSPAPPRPPPVSACRPDRQKEAPPSTLPRHRPKPPPATR